MSLRGPKKSAIRPGYVGKDRGALRPAVRFSSLTERLTQHSPKERAVTAGFAGRAGLGFHDHCGKLSWLVTFDLEHAVQYDQRYAKLAR